MTAQYAATASTYTKDVEYVGIDLYCLLVYPRWQGWVETLCETLGNKSFARYLCNARRPELKGLDASCLILGLYTKTGAGRHLEQPGQEGDVIGPFLQCGIEKRQRPLHSRGISAVALIMSVQCWELVSA